MPRAAFVWIHRRLLGTVTARGGNVVVLRAYGERSYDSIFYDAGRFAWVQSVLIPPCASRAQVDRVAAIVDRADAVYFAGGDQAHYVAWKGSRLMEAVKRVYERGGVVGGGSAGLAIQGAVVYDSVAADRLGYDTHTADAVKNPLEARISFTTGLFAFPPLRDTITDTHFVARDRFGRTVVFLAKILHDNLLPGARAIYALGVDQGSAVVVDPDGKATLFNDPGAWGAYLVRATSLPQLTTAPIRYTVDVQHVEANGATFDLMRKRIGSQWYEVTVDGSRDPIYSRDPYSR